MAGTPSFEDDEVQRLRHRRKLFGIFAKLAGSTVPPGDDYYDGGEDNEDDIDETSDGVDTPTCEIIARLTSDYRWWNACRSSILSLSKSCGALFEDLMSRVPLEQSPAAKAYLAEIILKAAAQGQTNYDGLLAAASLLVSLLTWGTNFRLMRTAEIRQEPICSFVSRQCAANESSLSETATFVAKH